MWRCSTPAHWLFHSWWFCECPPSSPPPPRPLLLVYLLCLYCNMGRRVGILFYFFSTQLKSTFWLSGAGRVTENTNFFLYGLDWWETLHDRLVRNLYDRTNEKTYMTDWWETIHETGEKPCMADWATLHDRLMRSLTDTLVGHLTDKLVRNPTWKTGEKPYWQTGEKPYTTDWWKNLRWGTLHDRLMWNCTQQTGEKPYMLDWH